MGRADARSARFYLIAATYHTRTPSRTRRIHEDADTHARTAGAARFSHRTRLHEHVAALGASDDDESIRAIHRAIDLGVTFFDTAAIYGGGHNEAIVGRGLGARRKDVVLATKCGIVPAVPGPGIDADGSPKEIVSSCEGSLRRLGTDVIDLFYLHRVDPKVVRDISSLDADDVRRRLPRFQGDNFDRNLALVARLEEIAGRKGCTPAQLALAWLLARGDDIVSIPGTKHVKFVEENVAATSVGLTDAEIAELEATFTPGAAAGERYNAAMGRLVER